MVSLFVVEKEEYYDFLGYLEVAEVDVGLVSVLCFYWVYYTNIFKPYHLSVISI